MIDFDNCSHRRWNPLTQSWVLCSPHRAKRPWQGQVEKANDEQRPSHDPKCFLCPRNNRIGGAPNPDYHSTYNFPNDFPAVQETTVEIEGGPEVAAGPMDSILFQAESTRGQCHVICFNPRHDLTIAQMTTDEIVPIVEAWTQIYKDFVAIPYINYCQIFENKGEAMGCSNPHPHGQVWGTEQVPEEPRKEYAGMIKYKDECVKCGKAEGDLLLDYARSEIEKKVRIVCENETFICVVPWWALWPFETLILPRVKLTSLLDFSPTQKRDLADILRRIACRYDNLFQCSFPYSMGLHQAPTFSDRSAKEVQLSQFHIHIYPPLLRSATVKKFLVGFEMLATPQRDLTSEQAAERIRSLSETHYKPRLN